MSLTLIALALNVKDVVLDFTLMGCRYLLTWFLKMAAAIYWLENSRGYKERDDATPQAAKEITLGILTKD